MSFQQLRKEQSASKTGHILFKGILGWGLCLFMLMTAFSHLQAIGFELSAFDGLSQKIVLSNLLIWTIFGYLFGVVTWDQEDNHTFKQDSASIYR